MSDDDKVLNDLLKDKLEDVGITPKTSGVDEIVCIVDRSGSMNSMRADAEGGLNSFIEEQKKVGDANLTIVEFDTDVDVVCDQVNINEAAPYVLKPRGMTALLDAIGMVIAEKEKYTTDTGKTIVVVMTDGDENSSREWKRDKIFSLINERKEEGWEFMFLAAGQDAISVGQSYGFDANSTVSFADNGVGATHANAVASAYTSGLRTMSKSAALKSKSDYIMANADVLSETGEVGKDKLADVVPDIISEKK